MEPTKIDYYRLEERLGAGGMGVVYRAYDERLDRWVALKLLRSDKGTGPQQRERFRREARASARLNHPNIVQVFDIIEADEHDGIVMEFVPGETLAQRLRTGPLAAPQALTLAREIADALAAAHEQGIVHRDLKTENVVIAPAGRAKILDFGIAKRLHGSVEDSLTAEGVVIGTCRAMAPEQAQGLAVDARSDLFSFGTLLYEAVTATSPFQAADEAATLRRICCAHQTPAQQRNNAIPESLSRLIDWLLEKDPESRPQSARKVAEALEAIASGSFSMPPHARDEASTLITGLQRRKARIAERRPVTVVRCGLTDAVGQPLDPEELCELLPELQSLATEVVAGFGGHCDAVLDHDLLAWFGYPQAHEDDARRAVYAAFELAERIGRSGTTAAKIGIHTGPMIFSRGTERMGNDLRVGEIPGIAALLREVAAAGSVLLSDATHEQVAAFFECRELDPVAAPGDARTVGVHRVVADRRIHSRLDSTGEQGLTPFVGRTHDVELLRERWRLAREGHGQAVLVCGEAGIGKSRLLHQLRRELDAEVPSWLACHCSPYHSNSALFPMVELLERWIGRGSVAERLGRLEELLGQDGLSVPENAPLFAALLSLPTEERYPPLYLSPEGQRKRTLEALLALLVGQAERQPSLLVVEDLHWIDPSTLELLDMLIAQSPAVPLLLVLTFRPEFQPPWSQRPLTQLTLTPLSRVQVQTIIDRLTGGKSLPESVRDQVIEKTDGLPLFVEEITKMFLEMGLAAGTEDGSGPAAPHSAPVIPTTLGGWLMARLDRLETAREVAQWAAALGREISYDLLSAVIPLAEEALLRELNRLVEAEILFRRGAPPRARYRFKHALLRDAAYNSLVRSSRQRFHRRIAEVMEGQFSTIAESQPELLAHHLTEAGLHEPAITSWQRAGEKAMQSSANQEAVGHLTRALEVLVNLPEGPERDEREIAIQVSMGVAQGQARSYSSPQARQAYARTFELCSRIGQTSQLFAALRGLWVSATFSGTFRQSLALAHQMQDLAGVTGDERQRLVAHVSAGLAHMYLGHFLESRRDLEGMVEQCDPDRAFSDALLPGADDPLVETFYHLGWTLWYLGYADSALARAHQAVALAQQLSNPFTLFSAHVFETFLWASRREPAEVLARTNLLLRFASEQEIGIAQPLGMILQGWALAEEGRVEEGIAQMCEGLAIRRSLGFRCSMPYDLGLLGQIYLREGRVEEGIAAVTEGLSLCAEGQEGFAADLLRIKGDLMALTGAPQPEVEEHLQSALELARRQSAKALELRTAMSLARLWARERRRDAARELLTPIYGWFTEGLDTADLREARALLAELR